MSILVLYIRLILLCSDQARVIACIRIVRNLSFASRTACGSSRLLLDTYPLSNRATLYQVMLCWAFTSFENALDRKYLWEGIKCLLFAECVLNVDDTFILAFSYRTMQFVRFHHIWMDDTHLMRLQAARVTPSVVSKLRIRIFNDGEYTAKALNAKEEEFKRCSLLFF